MSPTYLTLITGAVKSRLSRSGTFWPAGSECRIDSSDYFGRYVELVIPPGDVSDEKVRAELASLCAAGELAPDSAIVGC